MRDAMNSEDRAQTLAGDVTSTVVGAGRPS
jgi:hypothetical protein